MSALVKSMVGVVVPYVLFVSAQEVHPGKANPNSETTRSLDTVQIVRILGMQTKPERSMDQYAANQREPSTPAFLELVHFEASPATIALMDSETTLTAGLYLSKSCNSGTVTVDLDLISKHPDELTLSESDFNSTKGATCRRKVNHQLILAYPNQPQ